MITKVVIPAAGLGTRFLPLTKSVPKELLPVFNKPAIHWILEEMQASALTDVCMIIHERKRSLVEYLQPFNQDTASTNNKELIALYNLLEQLSITYITQDAPLGLGHAIMMAREYINHEYFAIALPDDLIIDQQNSMLTAMMALAQEKKALVLAVEEVPEERISSYGVVSIEQAIDNNIVKLNGVIEKPSISQAPSSLGIVGRYVCPPEIFDALQKVKPEDNREWQLTDAIAYLLAQGFPVYAHRVTGQRYDLGTPTSWLQANNIVQQKHTVDEKLC